MLLIVHPLAVCLFAVVGVNYYSSQVTKQRLNLFVSLRVATCFIALGYSRPLAVKEKKQLN